MDDQPKPGETASLMPDATLAVSKHGLGDAEKQVVSDLSRNLRLAGWFIILAVGLYFAIAGLARLSDSTSAPPFRISQVLWPLVLVLIGVTCLRASAAFRKFVNGADNDLKHLMAGFNEFNDLFAMLPDLRIVMAAGLIAVAAIAIAQVFGY